jgi:trehalose synthase
MTEMSARAPRIFEEPSGPVWRTSAVGGVAEQMVHGQAGLLLDGPSAVVGFAGAVDATVGDPEGARSFGANGHTRVVDRVVPDSQLVRWTTLLSRLRDR